MSCTRLGLSLLLLAALGWTEDEHGSEDSSHSKKKGPGHGHWSYADKDEWQLEFPFCGGQKQSPINIDTNSTIFSRELQPIVLAGYNLDPSEQLSLMNNGHTVVLRLPGSLTIASGYPQEYRAMQLHLHWGSPEGPGSEHTVDGRRYDGEIHMVYYNPSCGSIKEAMKQPGGLAVLAAFLQVGPEDNVHYQPLLEQLHKIQEEGKETTVAGFNIEGLLPANLGRYYRYSGSLTTPPCYQTVNWTVFNWTVLLSKEQISLLETTLQGDDDTDLQNNFRLIQHLHGRKVLVSFQASLSPRKVPLPDGGVAPMTPAPDSATERSMDKVPGTGAGCPPCADSEKQLGFALQTADVLAGLFGALFAVTALAFLIYIHRQRSQNRRPDSHPKPNIIYTAATTDENTV
ncbi:carbonic anhydrase 9 isoform X2 [Gopherus flavomarginatus]|uniref:carbonic anhydrase 9 isoform X2 n=1 Tax=Gopherus flavomarginatus TaxID=286002 RepID=UPI0021CC1FD2|nr:carbonic anhydrase 9 isoform X2 [Gopherus flavomarginatus]